MKIGNYLFQNKKIEKVNRDENFSESKCTLVLGFGSREILEDITLFPELQSMFPTAQIALCSTAGEIYDDGVFNNSLSLCAIEFDSTKLKTYEVNITSFESSFEAGKRLAGGLDPIDLQHIFVLSDGGLVNGSELVRGIENVIMSKISVTGGLAGDGSKFEKTVVGLNSQPRPGNIIAIGFYGQSLKVSHGSFGGWEMFGLEKTVTKSEGNVLYEIENENALDFYKRYLGKYADSLPGSALLFPLSIKATPHSDEVVRTILSIDNEKKCMTFAGDIPVGAQARLMRANFDNLIDAASIAAESSLTKFNTKPSLAILISCVGRKLIMEKRISEEVEAVKDVLGNNVHINGFYSYGEISPLNKQVSCQLHNQTMTITTFQEV